MNRHYCFVLTCVLLTHFPGLRAQSYQSELQYSHSNFDAGTFGSSDNTLGLTYYFQPNVVTDQPFGAVDFFERHSAVSIGYTLINESNGEPNADGTNMAFSYDFRSTHTPWLFGLSMGKTAIEYNPVNYESRSTSLRTGIYVNDSTRILLNWRRRLSDYTDLPGSTSIETYSNGISLRHANNTGEGTGSDLFLSASQSRRTETGFPDSHSFSYGIHLNAYTQRRAMLGFGIGAVHSQNIQSGREYNLNLAFQILPSIIAGLDVAFFKPDQDPDSNQTIGLFTSFRF